ncbi:MAG: cytidylate kinase-like family protein [Chloroflexi bacterium]|nr:cytidylate kinase-like family protein [Chloroflexota bacterium]
MAVITIRGLTGSGMREIGREVARLIQCDYVDREILEAVAHLIGYPLAQVEEKEQIPPRLAERILGVFERAREKSGAAESAFRRTWQDPLDDAQYLFALESVIKDLAMGGNVVLVGRGSQFILRNHPSALHVLMIASLAARVRNVMVNSNSTEEQARKTIEEADKARRAFIKRFFKRSLESPEHYDLVINTERLPLQAAVHIIISAAREKSGHSL